MRTVFFDVDTQIDFLYPAGALYAPGAERILPALARLNQNAPSLISTMDAHTEDDPEFRLYPHHCVAGALGQRKPSALLRSSGHQAILEKRTLDCFLAPDLPGLLHRLDADRYVVYGVVTEICVRFAALGLLRTGKRVEIVTDAVAALDAGAADRTFREFEAAGGLLTTSAAVLA